MSQYETDDEKVEAIKKWWKSNGLSVAAGVVIGLGAVFGWRGWIAYRDSVGGEASAIFEQLLVNADAERADSVTKQSEQLEASYASTPYAALAALMDAKLQYESGDTAAATKALEGVISRAPDPALARLAALRLARIQVSEGELDAAESTVKAHDDGSAFVGDFAAVLGDIAAARGDPIKAREQYERAIAAGSGLSQLLRLKLDNLPSPS